VHIQSFNVRSWNGDARENSSSCLANLSIYLGAGDTQNGMICDFLSQCRRRRGKGGVDHIMEMTKILWMCNEQKSSRARSCFFSAFSYRAEAKVDAWQVSVYLFGMTRRGFVTSMRVRESEFSVA
jgi:hypothetical protein